MCEITAVTSGKGGSGKTMAASNIAAMLAMDGRRVLLIDMNAGLRNLDICLGIENYVIFECKYTIVSEENEPKNIKMEGEFREDREGGLITEELLKATDKETGDDVFEIFPERIE